MTDTFNRDIADINSDLLKLDDLNPTEINAAVAKVADLPTNAALEASLSDKANKANSLANINDYTATDAEGLRQEIDSNTFNMIEYGTTELINSPASQKGVFNFANFAQQGISSDKIGFIFHHYTDSKMVQMDNVGTGTILSLKNAQNTNRRSDEDGSYFGTGAFLECVGVDASNNLKNYLTITKDGTLLYPKDAGTARFLQNKDDDGLYAFSYDAEKAHNYLWRLRNDNTLVLGFNNDVSNTRVSVESGSAQTNGLRFATGAGNITLAPTGIVDIKKPLKPMNYTTLPTVVDGAVIMYNGVPAYGSGGNWVELASEASLSAIDDKTVAAQQSATEAYRDTKSLLNIRQQEVLYNGATDSTINTGFIPNPDESFYICLCMDIVASANQFNMNGIEGTGGNSSVLMGSGAFGTQAYLKCGSLTFGNIDVTSGKHFLEIAYDGENKTASFYVDGRISALNQPTTLTQGASAFSVGSKTRADGALAVGQLVESNVYFTIIKNGIFATPPALNDIRKLVHNDVIDVAHQGYKEYAPENTMSAFKTALSKGATTLETDIRITSDGEYVLLHSSAVDAVSDGTGNISTLTLAQVKALDFGSYFSDTFAGEKIVTLKEFCYFARENNCSIWPEMKETFTTAQINDVVDIISDYGLIDKCVLLCFEHGNLAIARARNADLALGYLDTELVDVSTVLSNSWVLLNRPEILDNLGYVQTAAAAGIKVGAWTISQYNDYHRLADAGVKAIIADKSFKERGNNF